MKCDEGWLKAGTLREFAAAVEQNPPSHGVYIDMEAVHLPLERLIDDLACDITPLASGPAIRAASESHRTGDLVVVTPVPGNENSFRVVIGRGQVAAARQAGLATIFTVKCGSIDQVLLRLRGMVSDQPHDLVNPAEVALALRERLEDDPSLSHQDLARTLGKDASWVSHRLRILDLAPHLLAQVVSTQLRVSAHALGLIARLDVQSWQEELIDLLLRGSPERDIRARIRHLKGKPSTASGFMASYRARHQATVTIRSRFRNLNVQQRREVFMDVMGQDERQVELEEAKGLA